MIRILHLLDSEADFQTRRCAEQLSRDLGPGYAQEVRTIGPGGHWRGLPHAVRETRRMGTDLLVHAWGPRALLAAAIGTSARLVFTTVVGNETRQISWLRAVMPYRDVQVICPTSTLMDAMLRRGLPPEQCHLIRPGVEFSRVRARRQESLRQSLGFKPDDIVLLACGESTAAACHRDALWAAAILHVLEPRYKLLAWGRGEQTTAVEEFNRRTGSPMLLCLAERRLGRVLDYEELLPAADMIVISATGPIAPLPVCISMAAALPIAATVTPTVAELLEDRHTALMVPPHSPRQLARRILRLREEADLQWRVSDAARAEAFEYYSAARFAQQHRSLYEQCWAGGGVALARPETTGVAQRYHPRR